MMKKPIQWAAKLPHVRDVSLSGTADLTYWKDRLQPEGLLPAESGGRAQLMIVGADATFMGVRFRELSFSVLCSRPEDATRSSAYLVQAYNSCRFFAFCERVLFSTPYAPARVQVSTTFPLALSLARDGQVAFHASMGTDQTERSREPSRRGEEGWEGPIFLPAAHKGKQRWFFAQLRGQACAYPFEAGLDSMTIRPSFGGNILQALVDSHFVANEWTVREDATHAKSKTYASDKVFDATWQPDV